MRAGVSVFFTDIYKNEVVDLSGKWPSQRSNPFEIADIICAGGGKLVGFTDPFWLSKRIKNLCTLAFNVLKAPKKWQKHAGISNSIKAAVKGVRSLFISSLLKKKTPEIYFRIKIFFSSVSHAVLLKILVYTNAVLSFDYTSPKAVDYMASYGVWLELFTYGAMLDISAVHDVKTSIKIDWNRQDDVEIIGNEIDVTAMYKCRPVVISCKQSTNPVSADALNELYVVSRRIGGKYSIPILVTLSDIKHSHSGIYMKAREMKLRILDASDLMSGEFKLRLLKIITDNEQI